MKHRTAVQRFDKSRPSRVPWTDPRWSSQFGIRNRCQANIRIRKDRSHILGGSGTSRFMLPSQAHDGHMLTEEWRAEWPTLVVFNLDLASVPPEFLTPVFGGGGARMCISNPSWGNAADATGLETHPEIYCPALFKSLSCCFTLRQVQ